MPDPEKPLGGRLEEWFIRANRVYGYLHDDPQNRREHGAQIQTSSIVDIDYDASKVETLNTIYILGSKSTLVDSQDVVILDT